ncbi:parkin co-regulated protein-domain-containing protein [Phlyctochytrium arcticum]|nr:parkin co-regulated protein-domain-containing protein [Phlyctochytrium arcticum]
MLSRTSTGRLSGASLKSGSSDDIRTSKSTNSGQSSFNSSSHSLSNGVKSVSSSKTSLNSSRKPSFRLNPPVVSPMGNKKHLTSFSALYAKGEIPCKLDHGSVKHKIGWTRPPATLDYHPLLTALCDGLRETQHPYVFLVREGLKEALEAPGAEEKVRGVLSGCVPPLRAALSIKTRVAFITALDTLTRIATLVGPDIVPFLPTLIPPVASRVLAGDLRELVYDALRACEVAGGEPALKVITKLCPTYRSIFL